MADHCGEQCEGLTVTSNLRPCRASWTLGVHHPLQEQLLPEEILHKIFILVVLQDGDPAIRTLALTCTRFWRIVREESFLKEAHFCWLDSVVNWNSFSEEHRRTYRIPYLISRCIQCDDMYKDCEGYWGCGQRGKLQGFYSENDFAGYCCMDCFYSAGGTI
ncbi:hypothetical protein R3I94_021509 [Phoxinus phoxinus]